MTGCKWAQGRGVHSVGFVKGGAFIVWDSSTRAWPVHSVGLRIRQGRGVHKVWDLDRRRAAMTRGGHSLSPSDGGGAPSDGQVEGQTR